MNKKRRERVLKAVNSLEEISTIVEEILDEEQDAYDNMPENLLSSMRAEESEEAIETLDEAMESINSAVDALSEIC